MCDGAVEVLEPVGAEIDELGRRRASAAVAGETSIWPPWRESRDAGAAVDVDADVAFVVSTVGTPVWSPMRTRTGPSVESGVAPARAASAAPRGGGEGDEEGVALGVDLDTAVRCERLPQREPVLGERGCVARRARAGGAAVSSPRCP